MDERQVGDVAVHGPVATCLRERAAAPAHSAPPLAADVMFTLSPCFEIYPCRLGHGPAGACEQALSRISKPKNESPNRPRPRRWHRSRARTERGGAESNAERGAREAEPRRENRDRGERNSRHHGEADVRRSVRAGVRRRM